MACASASLTLRKRHLESDNNGTASKKPTILKTRYFKECWKSEFPCISYDSKTKCMFCDICIKSQMTNSFTTGCNILKKESITKHMKTKGM